MEGYEFIKQGMALIKEGCSKINFWEGCNGCPFEEFCDAITTGTKELFSPDDDF